MNATFSKFNEETKKAFSSCKYAFANIENLPAGMRNVWGDFTSKTQATEAAKAWLKAFAKFSPKLEARMEGKSYRIMVSF